MTNPLMNCTLCANNYYNIHCDHILCEQVSSAVSNRTRQTIEKTAQAVKQSVLPTIIGMGRTSVELMKLVCASRSPIDIIGALSDERVLEVALTSLKYLEKINPEVGTKGWFVEYKSRLARYEGILQSDEILAYSSRVNLDQIAKSLRKWVILRVETSGYLCAASAAKNTI